MNLVLTTALLKEIKAMRTSLFEFVKGAWNLVADSPLEGEDQIWLTCEYLEALYRGETRQLVINQPPATGKSRVCSILFPVWCWLQDPKLGILACSYSHSLGVDFGSRIIQLMQSEWFQLRFAPRLKGSKPSPSDFELEQGGWRYTTTPHGQVTGYHGDIRIVDDPIKPADAYSGRKEVENITRWFADTWLSRAKDLRTVRDLLVAQRLSEIDPSQYAMDRGWTSLVLPARFETGKQDVTKLPNGKELFTDWRKAPGELMGRMTDAYLDACVPYVYAAQYQQRPSAEGTRIFQEDQLERTWTTVPTNGVWCLSCDAAFKAEATSDFVVIQVWCRVGADYYLVDQVRDRMTFTETCAALERLAAKWPRARAKLVEDKANGSAIIDALGNKLSGLLGVNPEGGKVARANAVQPIFAAKNIILPAQELPERGPWLADYRRELLFFPLGKNDDQVDATTQALCWLSERGAAITAPDEDMTAALLGQYRPGMGHETNEGSGYAAWRMQRRAG